MALKDKILESSEDDAYYLAAMLNGEKSNILNEQERKEFIASLKVIPPEKEG